MAFPESFLQELNERSDIVDVVSGYVRLTKKSGQNMFGLCPFHSEKTPSFSVSPSKQIYHCFGCGKGGGPINFIMDVENLSFPDAVHFLANRAGMPVPEDKPDENHVRRERMLLLNRTAARFFYELLISPQGKPAQDYVNRRGISPAMVKNFGLGFAPDTWDTLIKAMLEKGFTRKELLEAGLAKQSQKGKGIYDAFRNRLMFPVIDVRGNVIGFSGRILGDGEPKYLNSPETLVFNKSRNLFALNLAKNTKSGYLLLSEGNIDVVALHQAGFDSAVASLGTSLTPEQARLMSRYVNQVIIAYDGDAAGQKASQRAIGILEKLDLKVRVLRMEGAKDPDEFIKTKGADAFRNLLEKSENHVEYRIDGILKKHDMSSDEGRVAFLKEAVDMLATLTTAVEREVYGMRVAEKAGVSPAAVESEVARVRQRRMAQAKKKEERDTVRSVRPNLAGKGIKYENERSARAEEGILRLLCADPTLFRGRGNLNPEDFSSPLLGRFYAEISALSARHTDFSVSQLADKFTSDEISHLTYILGKPEDLAHGARALDDYIEIVHREQSRLKADGSPKSAAEILQELEKIRKRQGYGV